MTQYEVAVVYDPDLEVDLEKATNKVAGIFKDNGVKVKKTDNWGNKKLAYKIKNHEHGIYVIYTVEAEPKNVMAVETTFNITDEIIRFLISKDDLKGKAKAEAVKAEQEKKAKERNSNKDDSKESDEEE